MKNKRRFGFTLAEVLITLGVIGIVAALTIPSLLNKTNDQELKNTFKVTFSEISQAANNMRSDNGGTLDGVFTTGDDFNAIEILKPYFSNIKTGNYLIVLNNGASITSSGSGWVSSSCNDQPSSRCLGLYIDVNGNKKPNISGKDQFYIKLQAHRTVPVGIQGDGSTCPGIGCAALVLQDIDY